MNYKLVDRLIKADGWYLVAQVGSHRQYRHLEKKGRVTVSVGKGDLPIGTLLSIEKQSGVKLRKR